MPSCQSHDHVMHDQIRPVRVCKGGALSGAARSVSLRAGRITMAAIFVHVKRAVNLRSADFMGKSDPYVRFDFATAPFPSESITVPPNGDASQIEHEHGAFKPQQTPETKRAHVFQVALRSSSHGALLPQETRPRERGAVGRHGGVRLRLVSQMLELFLWPRNLMVTPLPKILLPFGGWPTTSPAMPRTSLSPLANVSLAPV